MATATSAFPLATEDPYTGPGSASATSTVDNNAGASGSDSGAFDISRGGMIAIIVVVCVVAIVGSTL